MARSEALKTYINAFSRRVLELQAAEVLLGGPVDWEARYDGAVEDGCSIVETAALRFLAEQSAPPTPPAEITG